MVFFLCLCSWMVCALFFCFSLCSAKYFVHETGWMCYSHPTAKQKKFYFVFSIAVCFVHARLPYNNKQKIKKEFGLIWRLSVASIFFAFSHSLALNSQFSLQSLSLNVCALLFIVIVAVSILSLECFKRTGPFYSILATYTIITNISFAYV